MCDLLARVFYQQCCILAIYITQDIQCLLLFFLILRLDSVLRCCQPDLSLIKFLVNFQQKFSVAIDDHCLGPLFHQKLQYNLFLPHLLAGNIFFFQRTLPYHLLVTFSYSHFVLFCFFRKGRMFDSLLLFTSFQNSEHPPKTIKEFFFLFFCLFIFVCVFMNSRI